MAPPVQLTQETSTFETLYPVDSGASESAKLLRLVRGYKSQTLLSFRKIINVNIYGYIRTEAQMSSVTENSERAAMRQRINEIRNSLIKMGIPNDRIWNGGVAFASNMGGQINVYTNEINISPIILPPYTPAVPSNDPQKSPDAKEQWLDSEGTLKKDVLKGTLAVEIELSLKKGGIFNTKPPVSLKVSFKSDGSIELGAEWAVIEQEIRKEALWGAVQDIKFKISVEGTAEFKFEDKKIQSELNAAIKASLSATLAIPGIPKIPVEVSIGVAVDGKVVPGLTLTIPW